MLKKISDSGYSLVCTILLGLASLLRFVGYYMSILMVESVLHSARQRDPHSIIDHAGYYGQAVKEVFGTLSSLIVPSILNYVQPKWAMAIGASLFATYVASFLYINNYVYFIASALLGFAYSINLTASSTYQTEFCTKENLPKNAARVWGIGDTSLFVGAAIYIIVASSSDGQSATHGHRYYSAEETTLMYLVFTGVSLLSLVVYVMLPTRNLPDSVASMNPRRRLTIREQGAAVFSMLFHPSLLPLIPRSLHYGFFHSFYMNVYPTSLQFATIAASRWPLLAAYYAMARGAGCLFAMFATGWLSTRIKDFALAPLQYITLVMQLTLFALFFITTPQEAVVHPTAASGFLLEPGLAWALLIGFLIGAVDNAQNTSTMVIFSQVLPDRQAHVHSARRFYAGIASATVFFAGPRFGTELHLVLLTTSAIAGAIGFMYSVYSLAQRKVAAIVTKADNDDDTTC